MPRVWRDLPSRGKGAGGLVLRRRSRKGGIWLDRAKPGQARVTHPVGDYHFGETKRPDQAAAGAVLLKGQPQPTDSRHPWNGLELAPRNTGRTTAFTTLLLSNVGKSNLSARCR